MTQAQIAEFLLATRQGRRSVRLLRQYADHCGMSSADFMAHMYGETGYDVLRCTHCTKWVFARGSHAVNAGAGNVCTGCLDMYTQWCSVCGSQVTIPHLAHFVQAASTGNRRTNYDRFVGRYSSAPGPVMFMTEEERIRLTRREESGRTSNMIYLGVELEMAQALDAPVDILPRMFELMPRDFFILKHDGSLSGDYAMELVTSPTSLLYHQSGVWNTFFDNFGAHLRSGPAVNGGMHIHMTAAPLTPFTRARMITFVNRSENEQFMTLIAGREPNGFCRRSPDRKGVEAFTNKHHSESCPWNASERLRMGQGRLEFIRTPEGTYQRDEEGRLVLVRRDGSAILVRSRCSCPDGHYSQSQGRYEALNFNTSKPTVELRIFNGTVEKDRFMTNIEFAAALADFCSEMRRFADMTPVVFCEWVQSRRKVYPALFSFLVDHDYCTAPKKRVNA